MASLTSILAQRFAASRQTFWAAPLFLATPAPSTNNGHQCFAHHGRESSLLTPLVVYGSNAVLTLTDNDKHDNGTL